MVAQLQKFWEAHERLAAANRAFVDAVREGLSREELAKLIEMRPEQYGRFSAWLSVLPSVPFRVGWDSKVGKYYVTHVPTGRKTYTIVGEIPQSRVTKYEETLRAIQGSAGSESVQARIVELTKQNAMNEVNLMKMSQTKNE